MNRLDVPFPWFGGKRLVASDVWQRFGDVANYVEPFFGSGAVLLGRPSDPKVETINDLDGFVANFWRSIKHEPEAVAEWASDPVNENDLHAKHSWLIGRIETMRVSLEGDPTWYDPQIAGWWVWGICCWIGSGFCSGNGPWSVNDEGQLVHLGDQGRGVNRQRVHLGDQGRGVNRQRVHLGNWFNALSARLRGVRVCSGDWSRVCGPSVTFKHGMTGVFLDPPYSAEADRYNTLYRKEDLSVAHEVRDWAIENGKRRDMRIALCGYEGEHKMPSSWTVHKWKTPGGYESQSDSRSGNCMREVIYFSPACLGAKQQSLF